MILEICSLQGSGKNLHSIPKPLISVRPVLLSVLSGVAGAYLSIVLSLPPSNFTFAQLTQDQPVYLEDTREHAHWSPNMCSSFDDFGSA